MLVFGEFLNIHVLNEPAILRVENVLVQHTLIPQIVTLVQLLQANAAVPVIGIALKSTAPSM